MKIEFRTKVVVVACVMVALAQSEGSTEAAKPSYFCHVDTAKGALSARVVDNDRALTEQPRGIALLVSNAQIALGESIYARLANFGGKRAFYGREFVIQRRSEGGWERDPASPTGPWVRVAGVLKPGSAGRCYRFDVPMDQPTGQYRFSTRITGPEINKAAQHRTAAFRVGDPAGVSLR